MFDDIFEGDDVKASVSRKDERGVTRLVRLNVAPKGNELEDFAASAKSHGAVFSRKGKSKGANTGKSVERSGVKAERTVLMLGDDYADTNNAETRVQENAGTTA